MILSLYPVTFFFNSCETDLGVTPTYSSRDITGTVVDWHNKKSLSAAKITIIPNNSTAIYSCNTDDSGNFIVKSVPMLPESQKYTVRVEKNFYEGQDFQVNCNCTKLNIDTVQLKRLQCGLNFNNSTLTFDVIPVNEEEIQSLLVTNPTPQEVIITKVELNINSCIRLDSLLSNVPLTLSPNSQQRDFKIRFTPTEERKYFDTLKIFTECREQPYLILILGEGQLRKCSYSPVDTIPLTISNKSDSIIIRNLSTKLDLDVKFLYLPAAPFKLDKNIALNSIIKVPANQSYILQVSHQVNNEIEAQDSVVFETNGDCQTQPIPIQLSIGKPKCEYNLSMTDFTFSQDSAYLTIRNLSEIPLLVDIVKPPKNVFKLIPDSLHYTIEPFGFRRITIVFNPLENGIVTDTLEITTNGECGGQIFFLAGKYEEFGYLFKDLSAWDDSYYAKINPEYRFTGFRFGDDKIVVDSTYFCPLNNFGKDSADFRFEGFTSLFSNTVAVRAYGGLKKIGSIHANNKPFTLKDWKDLIDANMASVGPEKGCGAGFNRGDVLLVKTREDKFILLMINTWYTDIYGVDYLKINYWKITE